MTFNLNVILCILGLDAAFFFFTDAALYRTGSGVTCSDKGAAIPT